MWNSMKCTAGLLTGCLMLSSTAHAEKTVTKDISFSKVTTDFQIKNSFPIMPLTSATRITKIEGTLFTITRKGEKQERFPSSETLFSLTGSQNGKCPAPGQSQPGYPEISQNYKTARYGAMILKQVRYGTKTFPFSYSFPEPMQINAPPGSCLFINFDGTDFANGLYTMGAHLKVTYDDDQPPTTRSASAATAPQIAGLDFEFLLSVSNKSQPTLNGYVVLPVHHGGPLEPGTRLVGIIGNASASAVIPGNVVSYRAFGNWSVTHNVVVYTHGSCQRAFKNHGPDKFAWNDPTGTSTSPNKTSMNWPEVIRIAEVPLVGTGDSSVAGGIELVSPSRLPMVLQDGDCVANAVIPKGDMAEPMPYNSESQIYLEYLKP